MRLDKLQIDLRPRPNAQALDLGFALLRSHARDVYLAWLALWLPLMGLSAAMACLLPAYSNGWVLLAWWLKPLLERAPLYILSRQVFGEAITWKDGLRAWPKQLRGGWFRLLTWWRLFMPGRGLYQAIWQLENARGTVAAERRKVIGAANTGRAAYWFGVACAQFDAVLQFGLMAFIGIFLTDENLVNPFAYLIGMADHPDSALMIMVTFACFALSGAIIGPVYISCCFTLYLNRRATLEAWDIEIMLRQITPPTPVKHRPAAIIPPPASLAAFFVPVLLALVLTQPSPAAATGTDTGAAAKPAGKCTAPEWLPTPEGTRKPDRSAQQAQLRNELAQLFDTDDLRGYLCEENWHLKKPRDKKQTKQNDEAPKFETLARISKVLLIAAVLWLIGWLLYRYREKFAWFIRPPRATAATEIGGLDIRAESLPDDVPEAVRQLWAKGERRAALALLYRATLSRLVSDDRLLLTAGATEGDCLRAANQAHRRQRLDAGKLQVATSATEFWLNAAYGDRWPDSDAVSAGCSAWQAQFGQTVQR